MGQDTDFYVVVRTPEYALVAENWEILRKLALADDEEIVAEFPAWRCVHNACDDELVDIEGLYYGHNHFLKDTENGIIALEELLVSSSADEFNERLETFASCCWNQYYDNIIEGEMTCFFKKKVYDSTVRNLSRRSYSRLNCADGQMYVRELMNGIQEAVASFVEAGVPEEKLIIDSMVNDSY